MTDKYKDYEQWTVTQLDEDGMKIGEEEYEDEEEALEAYRSMICENSPTLGARLSHHTDWEMIDKMLTSKTWTDIDTHEAGEKCHCIDCCEHPSCATTGVCVAHCEECNGECVAVSE
tara:strand:+ start:135 stop:485 length:351 start_codon:yes stop_codon:yes gene_type:complete